MRLGILALGVVTAVVIAPPAAAKDHVVQMLNKGPAGMFVFEPALTRIAPGDTVTFVATDQGHGVESIPGMIPPGAVPFKGGMNQTLTVKFTKPGVYGFKCAPHYVMGMVGAVIVGNPDPNIQAAKAVSNPGKAQQTFRAILR